MQANHDGNVDIITFTRAELIRKIENIGRYDMIPCNGDGYRCDANMEWYSNGDWIYFRELVEEFGLQLIDGEIV